MMTWLEVLKVSNSHVWPRVGHDLVPTLTLSSPSVHDQYFVPSPELELWQNVGLFSWPPVSGISNTMSQNVGGSEREAEIIMFFCEKSVFDIMSWFAICRVSFQKHSNKHESCKHESGQTRPPANTIFTMNFSISQNFPQTNLLKMTLLQLTYSGEIICKKIASCPNESRH